MELHSRHGLRLHEFMSLETVFRSLPRRVEASSVPQEVELNRKVPLGRPHGRCQSILRRLTAALMAREWSCGGPRLK